MNRINVIILDNNIEERFTLENILANIEYINVINSPESVDGTMTTIEQEDVDVVLISSTYGNRCFEFIERIEAEHMDKASVLIAPEVNEDIIYQAMFAGAKDVFAMPVKPDKLVDSIYRANQQARKRVEFQAVRNTVKKKHGVNGEVFTLFSTKGGTGKTFLAANIAVALQERTDKKIALVDFNLESGNLALALDLQPRFSVRDVIDDIKNLDPEYLATYMTNYNTNMQVLAGSKDHHSVDFISAEHIQTILKNLQLAYDYVIIDMPSRFDNHLSPAFLFSDKLFLVTTADVMSMHNTKGALTTLIDVNYPKAKIHLIVNKYLKSSEIKLPEVEKTFGLGAELVVPEDSAKAVSSLNQGNPYVKQHPKSELTRSINEIVDKILRV